MRTKSLRWNLSFSPKLTLDFRKIRIFRIQLHLSPQGRNFLLINRRYRQNQCVLSVAPIVIVIDHGRPLTGHVDVGVSEAKLEIFRIFFSEEFNQRVNFGEKEDFHLCSRGTPYPSHTVGRLGTSVDRIGTCRQDRFPGYESKDEICLLHMYASAM